MKADWRSYDAIADSYARVAEHQCFAPPARDIVALLELAPGSRLLDVGAGTGAVAMLAAEIVGLGGLVVGLDPSIEMVRRLAQRCRAYAVVGVLPKLPHPDASFDAVAAAFVLTHVADYAGALQAMARTLRPGGRLAISSWAESETSSPAGKTFQAAVDEFVGDRDLRAGQREALPWVQAFAEAAFLETALNAAGLVRVQLRQTRYRVEMSTESFVELRLISTAGRLVKSILPGLEWDRLKERACDRLLETFGPHLDFELLANIAAGSKPDG